MERRETNAVPLEHHLGVLGADQVHLRRATIVRTTPTFCDEVQQVPRSIVNHRRRLRILGQHEVQHLHRGPKGSKVSREHSFLVLLLERVLAPF
jgi:hypothetical protein